jgi:glycoside/pentoside/hexuronide:cation symporter, GPH family
MAARLRRIPRMLLLYWGLASMGLAMIGGIFGSTLPIFYQDYLGLSARWISIVSLLYAVWNAVNDPLFGFVTDSTRSKRGRRIPYLRFTAPFLALTFVLVWMVPYGASEGGLFAWMLISMLLYDTCFTIIGLVQSALLPEISEYEDDRAALQAATAFANLLGFALGFIVPQLFRPTGSGAGALLAMRLALLAVGLIGSSFLFLLSYKVKERPLLREGERSITFREYLSFTFSSTSALIVIAANFMRILVQTILMGAVFYLADYLVKINGIVLMLSVIIPMVAGIAAAGPLRRRLGVLGTQQLYLGMGAAGLLSMLFMPIPLIPLSLILAGFGMGGPEALTYVLLSQTIDEDELRTGQRREGAFFGTNALLTKPAQSLALAIPPFILESTGFITREANNGLIYLDQPESALLGIRIYTGLIPGIAYIAAVIILCFYPIRGEYKRTLEQKVLARHAQREGSGEEHP